MSDPTRRDFIKSATVGATGLLIAQHDTDVRATEAVDTASPATTMSPAFAVEYQPKALAFDPAKLTGISE